MENSSELTHCPQCQSQYDAQEVAKIYGYNSAEAKFGFCTTKCYIKYEMNNLNPQIYKNIQTIRLGTGIFKNGEEVMWC